MGSAPTSAVKPANMPRARVARACLRCGLSFPSEGAHERICQACKQTPAWRDGRAVAGPGEVPPTRNRLRMAGPGAS